MNICIYYCKYIYIYINQHNYQPFFLTVFLASKEDLFVPCMLSVYNNSGTSLTLN